MRPILLSALLVLCAIPAAGAQASRNWRPEDRLVVGDWTTIRAVAAGPDRVFIVSPDGVLAFSPLLRRWEGPFVPPVAGALERVTAGMIDPLDNSLWLSASDGWVHFQPDVQVWERGEAGGRLLDFAFDLAAPFEGLFLRTAAGWSRVPRGALIPVPSSAPIRPIRPATVAQALASNPALGGAASAFLLDPSLQNARLTSAARSFDNLGWYLGTDGVGALFVADGMVVPQRLNFGLPGPVVGAIYAVPGGVWVLNDRMETGQSALTFVASDLTEFRVFSGPAATGLPYTSARRLIGVGNGLWAATDAGVLRFDTEDPAQFRLYDERAGLPDRRVASIASRRGIIVAATARGLARFIDTTGAEPLAPDYAGSVGAVAVGPDTAWIGISTGPRGAAPGVPGLILPVGVDESAAFGRAVYDFAWLADTLVGITSDQLLWRIPGEGRWVMGAPISSVVGPLRRLVADGDGLWVAGDLGVGWTRLIGAPVRPLTVDGDLPGAPLDLAVDADYLWVGTTAGLVRFRLSEVRP